MLKRRSIVLSSAEKPFHLHPEVSVHERIDDWIGDIVGEVHVEDRHVVWYQVMCHQMCREERHYEHDGHHKQNSSRLYIGYSRGRPLRRTVCGPGQFQRMPRTTPPLS